MSRTRMETTSGQCSCEYDTLLTTNHRHYTARTPSTDSFIYRRPHSHSGILWHCLQPAPSDMYVCLSVSRHCLSNVVSDGRPSKRSRRRAEKVRNKINNSVKPFTTSIRNGKATEKGTRSSADAEIARHASCWTRIWLVPNAISGTSGSRRRPQMVLLDSIRSAKFDFLLLCYTDLTHSLHRWYCCRRSAKFDIYLGPI